MTFCSVGFYFCPLFEVVLHLVSAFVWSRGRYCLLRKNPDVCVMGYKSAFLARPVVISDGPSRPCFLGRVWFGIVRE